MKRVTVYESDESTMLDEWSERLRIGLNIDDSFFAVFEKKEGVAVSGENWVEFGKFDGLRDFCDIRDAVANIASDFSLDIDPNVLERALSEVVRDTTYGLHKGVNDVETEADGIRAEQLRRAKVRHFVRAAKH